MGEKKIIEHPSAMLNRKIQEQQKKIDALQIDVSVLRDLLRRTIKMLSLADDVKSVKVPADLLEKLKKNSKDDD